MNTLMRGFQNGLYLFSIRGSQVEVKQMCSIKQNFSSYNEVGKKLEEYFSGMIS